jgi:hypothetical protein
MGGANINAGDFTNNATIRLVGGTLSATGSGTESRNQGSLDLGTDGLLDVEHNFFNDTPGSITYNGSTFEFARNFTNSGTINRNNGSEVKFDGGGVTQTISGSNLTGSDGGFTNLTVTSGSKVNPNPGNGTILVTGALTIKSNGQYGTDPDGSGPEEADLRYDGESFDVGTDAELFADVVTFGAGNKQSGSYTTVEGAVFAKVDIINKTAVEVGSSSFTVNGPVFVNDGNVLNVENFGTTLELASDFQNNGTIEAKTQGTIKFNGEGAETDCSLGGTSDLTCASDSDGDSSDKNNIQEYAGASAEYNALRIQDDDQNGTADTNVKFSDSGSPVIVNSDLIIEEASLETVRPLELNNGNLDVRTDGSIDFKGDRLLTLSGSSPASISTQSPLEIATINMDKDGGTMTFNDDITVTERLRMLGGTLEPVETLTIQNVLQLGDPNDDNTSPVIDVTAGGGTLELVSNGDNDAYVEYVDSDGDDTNDGSITGPVTYQRYLNGSVDWYYMATPAGGNNTSFDEFLQQGPSSAINDLRTRGVTGADDKQDKPAYASVRLYDETEPGPIDPSGDEVDAGWKAIDCQDGYPGCVSGLGDPMESGRGYAVYGYNNDVGRTSQSGFPKTIDSNVENPITSTSFDFTPLLDATGQGDGIDANDGWNLLGNPYMTTLDFCAMSDANLQGGNNDDTRPDVQVWDPQNSAYASYNCDTGTANGAGGGLTNGYIAPHQAFFVKATSSSPSLTITDITSVQANASDFFQKSAPTQKSRQESKPPAVSLQLALDEYKYTTSVSFLEGRTTGMDQSDSYYFGGKSKKSGMSFYSVLDDGTAIIANALPRDFSEDITVPLAIDGCDYKTALKGEATITWPTLRNIPASWGLVLKDTQTGSEIDLSSKSSHTFAYDATGECSAPSSSTSSTAQQKSLSSPSVVQHSVPKSGGPNTRFQLVIDPTGGSGSGDDGSGGDDSGNSTIQFGDFLQENGSSTPKVSLPASSVVLQHNFRAGWTDVDPDAPDADAYTREGNTITINKGALEPGTHEYRLKASAKSSGDKTSKVVRLNVLGEELTTYPNPASQGQATVEFVVEEPSDVTVSLYNTLGQKVRTLHRGEVQAGETVRETIAVQSLASGVYFVRMRGDGVMTTTRMTVVK